jgi:phosphoribosyl 1,2-cyclic phosphodiesterase
MNITVDKENKMLELCMLASGSAGNAVYIGTEKTKILIDAGLSCRRLTAALQAVNTDASCLDALFISHEHTDHIRGAGVLSRRYKLPVYATAATWETAGRQLEEVPKDLRRVLPDCGSYSFRCLEIETFPVPHDATGPVGFVFRSARNAAALVTDLGHITTRIVERLQKLDCLVLEANYDEEMLLRGPYPWPLKRRILGSCGHLSNEAAGELLLKIISPQMKHVILAHLSEQNNRPRLAYKAVCSRLEQAGVSHRPRIHIAARQSPSCYLRLA